ncbi:MAG: helix-turn-helix domain-containing protein [Proteobacteria bacterium]|nr:helix-turn-helix domain-containing protein [Pseudomonadota bacterium]
MHFNYTVAEAALLFDVHRNTVRNWTRTGLRTFRAGKAILILGEELRRYLTDRRAERRTACPPGSMYCLRCRAPRTPAQGMVEAVSVTQTTVNLRGLCDDCEGFMHRRASLARLEEIGFGWVCVHAATAEPSR